jgi:hypothetical protein
MPDVTRSLAALTDAVALRKHRAAQARFAGTPGGAEVPRDVFLGACGDVAVRFEPQGFRYAKSGPHFTRRAGEFTFQVSFQSSHNNVAGEYVAMWVHGIVRSSRLKSWRRDRQDAHGVYDTVAGGQIGNLGENTAWMEWNLADPATRAEEISSAASEIERLALPYFDLFGDVPSLCQRLIADDLPSMFLWQAFDFLACFESVASAGLMLRRFLLQRPQLQEEYRRSVARYEQKGVPAQYDINGIEREAAALSARFGLGDVLGA